MVIRPSDIPTVDMLRDELRRGHVSEFTVVVANVLNNGVAVPAGEVTAPESQVSYNLAPVDTAEQFPPEVLNGVVPYNRPIRGNGRLVSAAVGDPMRLMRYGEGHITPFVYRLFQMTERGGYVRCDGTPLE